TLSTRVVGNRNDALTAISAAPTVPTTYSSRIGRMWVPPPPRWPAIAAATSTSTSTGATALSASTNAVPSSSTERPAAGQTTPTRVPRSRAMTIWVTRLGRRRNAGSAMQEGLLLSMRMDGSGGRPGGGGRREGAVDRGGNQHHHQHRHRPAQ